VVCAAQVTQRLRPGVVSASASSAKYQPLGEPGNSTDIGGCVNLLCPKKCITKKTTSMAPNTTLIQVEKWDGSDSWRRTEEAS